MKSLARTYVYWLHLDKHIKGIVRQYTQCQVAVKQPVTSNLFSWPKPTHPWQHIHMDFAEPYQRRDYLVIMDAYSKYPEIFIMRNATSLETIEALHQLVIRHGLSEHNLVGIISNSFASKLESYIHFRLHIIPNQMNKWIISLIPSNVLLES